MEYQSIEVRPVTPTIGAEIFGVELGSAISNQQFDDIHTALLEHVVIFFRDQKMTPEQHKDFGRRFGKLHMHPASPNLVDGHPEILLIKADQNSKRVAGEVWHSDVSCDAEPPMGSILYMLEPPSNGGGDTMFANMYTAYDTLSESVKRFLEGLTAVHDGEHVYRGRYQYTKDPNKVFPRSAHPVVRTHPETGRKALYVNRIFTRRIVGMYELQSRHLLNLLYEHCTAPEFQARFQWRQGAIAVWDNRCTLHYPVHDYNAPRVMWRVSVEGSGPLAGASTKRTSAKSDRNRSASTVG